MNDQLLHLYRERCGHPGFWAEPVNALTNASFLVAAFAAWALARRHGALTESTWALIALAAAIGVGSFLFHTTPNRTTLWLDVGPIALFIAAYLWLAARHYAQWTPLAATAGVFAVVGLSFALMPLHRPLNGSLFYLPTLAALACCSVAYWRLGGAEPSLLFAATAVFALSMTARSLDKLVPFPLGAHFLWHLFNGVAIWLATRAWILHILERRPT